MIHIIREKNAISVTGHASKTVETQTKDAIAACSGVTILMETLADAFDRMSEAWRTAKQTKGEMVIYIQNISSDVVILVEAISRGLQGMAQMYPDYVDYQEM